MIKLGDFCDQVVSLSFKVFINMKQEFLVRDDRLLKSMMLNVYSVQKFEKFASLKKSVNSKKKQNEMGKSRHHNVMVELDNVRTKEDKFLQMWNEPMFKFESSDFSEEQVTSIISTKYFFS